MTTISLELSFKIHDTRQRAARLIEERGWWPGSGEEVFQHFTQDEGPCCLVESVAIAAEYEPISSAVLKELRRELGVENLANWNDEHSKEEVIAALRGQQS